LKVQGIAQVVMRVEASGFTLMVLGAAATIAALAGQLNVAGVAEFPLMKSGVLRAALFLTGGFFFLIGLGLVSDVTATSTTGPPSDPGPGPGSDSSPVQPSSEPETTTTPEGQSSYARAVNAACEAAASRAQQLPELPENANDDQLVQYTLTWADNVAILWDSLANISPAGGVPDDHETLLFKLELYHDNLEDAGYGLRAGDGYTFDNNINRVESLAFDYNRVAKALDLPSCELPVS
jgi:hypothetical protein